MRLHSAKVPQIAAEMVGALVSGGDVETESPKEVGLDIASVLNQYIRDEQEVSTQAKDMLAARGLPQTEYNRIRKLVAEERKNREMAEQLRKSASEFEAMNAKNAADLTISTD